MEDRIRREIFKGRKYSLENWPENGPKFLNIEDKFCKIRNKYREENKKIKI